MFSELVVFVAVSLLPQEWVFGYGDWTVVNDAATDVLADATENSAVQPFRRNRSKNEDSRYPCRSTREIPLVSRDASICTASRTCKLSLQSGHLPGASRPSDNL